METGESRTPQSSAATISSNKWRVSCPVTTGVQAIRLDTNQFLSSSNPTFLKPSNTNLSILVPQMIEHLIELGNLAQEIKHALGNNGNQAGQAVELIQHLINNRG